MSTDNSTVSLTAPALDNLIEAARATLQPGRPEVQAARRESLKTALTVVVAERAVSQFLDGLDAAPEPGTTRRPTDS